MLMAAIGEVRGNFSALQAVLNAIEDSGIQTIIQTGNIGSSPSSAETVIAFFRNSPVPGVQGEFDRLLGRFERKRAALLKRLEPAEYAALESAHAALSSASLEFLRALPRQRRLDVDGVSVLACYGAVTGASGILTAETPHVKFQREREAALADVVVCGGAPEPFSLLVEHTLFVSPGPLNAGPGQARYAVISTEEEPWSAEFPVVPCSEG
jgi:predicted phosphodiesterase